LECSKRQIGDVAAIGDKYVNEYAAFNFTVSADDADDDNLILSSNVTDLSFGTFQDNGDGTGSLEFTPTFTESVSQVTVSVTDGTDSDSETFTLTVGGNTEGSGDSDQKYRTKPTFGLDHQTQFVKVEGGFTANGKIFDITDNWHTDFERQAIVVGQTNTFSAKAHAPYVLNVVEFMFGIPEVGFAHMAEASIEVTIDRDLNITNIRVIQEDNLINPDSVSASATMAQCKSGDVDKKCYFVTISAVFYEDTLNDIFALKGIDFTRRYHITYLNEGFTIIGESLNPATTLLIASNVKGSSGLMQVTQIDKRNDMWISDSGIEFKRNSFGTFLRTTPVELVRDDPIVKVMTRLNSNFDTMKINEMYRGVEVFDSGLLQKELPDFILAPVGQGIDKRNDPEFLKKLVYEEMRATDNLTQMLKELYPSDFYESGEVTNPSRLISYGL